jgi:hypothetical protein
MSKIVDWARQRVDAMRGGFGLSRRERNTEKIRVAIEAVYGADKMVRDIDEVREGVEDNLRDVYNMMNNSYEQMGGFSNPIDLYEFNRGWDELVRAKESILEALDRMEEGIRVDLGSRRDIEEAEEILREFADEFDYPIPRDVDYNAPGGEL